MEESPQIIGRGYCYWLHGNAKAEALLRRGDGCCTKVWNFPIAEQQRRHAGGEKYANYVAMCKWLTACEQDPMLALLNEMPEHVLQNAPDDLDVAYQRFFRKKGSYPKFKRFGAPTGLGETDIDCFEVDNINGVASGLYAELL